MVFRAMAAERGMTVADLGAVAETDATIDVALDERLAARARAGNVVLESRLAGWIAHNEGLVAGKVWIACDESVRAARVAGRDDSDDRIALAANQAREASEHRRYRAYYGIDLSDLRIYDLVLDSTARPARALVDEIVAAVEGRAPSAG